jgi:hypothetical protein
MPAAKAHAPAPPEAGTYETRVCFETREKPVFLFRAKPQEILSYFEDF